MTQIRWASRSRSRSKERRMCRKDNQEVQGQDVLDHQALQGESRLRRDSTTDYAADNSSEHSSTATPLTQSPRHRLLNIQHGNDGMSSLRCVLCTCVRALIADADDSELGYVQGDYVNFRSVAITQLCYTEWWRL
jgi:hypothetical protein